MKRLLICHMMLLLFLFAVSAQKSQPYCANDKKVNWGLKLGFNSAIPSAEVETGDNQLTTKTINKVGYLAETFVRVNFKKVFVQPEISYSITKENIYFLNDNDAVNPSKTAIDIKVNAFDVSTILGYNTVKQNEYGLSVFSGLKLKYAYQIDVSPSNAEKMTNTDPFYNMYVTTGVGVNISHLFFDFRYDFALWNNKMEIPNGQASESDVFKINKKANILSFSIGLMF